MSEYEYQNSDEVLNEYIDKLARGIMPMVDELTWKEIELKMHELASQSAEDAEDEEEIAKLMEDTKVLREKAQETKRKATRKDVAYFTLTDEQKKQLREDMSASYVRSSPSSYNTPDEKINEDKERMALQKRASRIRRCYYHADEWIAAMQTILDIIDYDSRNYPWMTKHEYYESFWKGTIKLNVIVPMLFMDYHTPIKDPVVLASIFKGETIVEEKHGIDTSNKVRVKDDKAVWMDAFEYSNAEVNAMQQLASQGYDTPVNHILKDTHKSLYDRFLPVSKRNGALKFKGKINELLKEYKRFNKFDGLDMVPYKPSDIVTYIHKQNEGKLNASISTATTKFLSMLSDKQEIKIDTSFKANDVLINAEGAIKEAEIMANIKSIGGNTKY